MADKNIAVKKIDGDNLFFQNRIEEKWLSSEEASNYLSITQNALRIMVHRGKIRAFKLGRRLRFRLCDLECLLEKKEVMYG